MTILLATLAVAFAAFCVWLTVRIVNRRERWAKRTLAAMIGVSVLYVASFGPACWWLSSVSQLPIATLPAFRRVSAFYEPIGWAALRGPAPVRGAVGWYATFGLNKNETVECELGLGGRYTIITFTK